MKVFVKNKENNEIIQIYNNVINYDEYSIEYTQNGCRCKIYIDTETEYIDNKEF